MGTTVNLEINLSGNNTKSMLNSFLEQLNQRIQKKRNIIKQRIISLVVQRIVNSKEYKALISDAPEDYQAEFGIIDPNGIQNVLNDAIEILTQQFRLYFVPFKAVGPNTVGGTFRFDMIKSGLEEFVNVEGGSYLSNEYNIEWLRWIVLMGDFTIDNYSIEYDIGLKQLKTSRSKRAVMVEDGGHWLVPEPFRGDNAEDNFITRALENLDDEITNILLDEVST